LYTPKSTGARIALIIFYIISIAIVIWIESFFIDFANAWPDWGPGPSPSLFVWIPFAIAGIMVLMLVVQVVNMVRKPGEASLTPKFSMRTHSYDDIPASSSETLGYHETTVSYRTPPFCSQCGASLDSDLVEWVGPLRFRCPSCGKTGKAEEIRD
jgi:predicted RNA-binding Zn-ribbon protein involved in translation (DUF1610 family)